MTGQGFTVLGELNRLHKVEPDDKPDDKYAGVTHDMHKHRGPRYRITTTPSFFVLKNYTESCLRAYTHINAYQK